MAGAHFFSEFWSVLLGPVIHVIIGLLESLVASRLDPATGLTIGLLSLLEPSRGTAGDLFGAPSVHDVGDGLICARRMMMPPMTMMTAPSTVQRSGSWSKTT